MFQNYDRVIFFDTETSGLRPEVDRVIEIGAILMIPSRMVMKKPRDWMIRVDFQLDPKVTAINHITNELLEEQGVPLEEAMNAFLSMIDGRVLMVAHNAHFDIRMIDAELKRLGLPSLRARGVDFLDTLTVTRDLREYAGKLEKALAAFNITDAVNSHRACDDALACAKLCKALNAELTAAGTSIENYINIFGWQSWTGIQESDYVDGITYLSQERERWINHKRPQYLFLDKQENKPEQLCIDLINDTDTDKASAFEGLKVPKFTKPVETPVTAQPMTGAEKPVSVSQHEFLVHLQWTEEATAHVTADSCESAYVKINEMLAHGHPSGGVYLDGSVRIMEIFDTTEQGKVTA